MKKILTNLFLIGSVTAFFASCKKEELAKPEAITGEAVAVTNAASDNNSLLAAAPTYTLTRRDNDSLVYYNDGRLAKVVHGASTYTQYNYGFNTVITKEYSKLNNQLKEEVVYQVDPQTGRTYESKSTVYSYNNNGVIVITKTFKYEYDANGRITRKQNKAKIFERTDFTWYDGDLKAANFYNENGARYTSVGFSHFPDMEDKLKLQPKRSQLDPYLKIFGKGSKNLIGFENVHVGANQQPTTQEDFYYWLNIDGYPTGCKVTDRATKQIIKYFDYSYLVSRSK